MTALSERRTRIVATLGPSSSSPARLRRLIRAGVDVVRLNFSHGSHAFHQQLVTNVRAVAAELGRPVAILQDLSGPKMRVGRVADDAVRLRAGHEVVLVEGHGLGSADKLHVEAAGAIRKLVKGSLVRLADGLMELRVAEVLDKGVRCAIVHGGTLRSRQGVNIPGADLGVASLTRKDKADLAFGMRLGVDAVALSFVTCAKDVLNLRRLLSKQPGRRPFVVAKIERGEALENLEEILDVASGVMVARGDLGVEIGFEKVPAAQRLIVERAQARHRPVITATQMLESMIDRPTPTRAEVSDIATAVMEGTDALMLSGETAVGRHPVEAVAMLDKVAREVESSLLHARRWERIEKGGDDVPQAVSRAARVVARSVDAKAVLAFTEGGRTARLVSSQRVGRPCYGFTPSEETWRRMSLFWGIRAMLMPHADSVLGMICAAEAELLRRKVVRKGDKLVVVCGQLLASGSTNSIHVIEVGWTPAQPARKKRAKLKP